MYFPNQQPPRSSGRGPTVQDASRARFEDLAAQQEQMEVMARSPRSTIPIPKKSARDRHE